ncbi:hypothetical protein QQS21_009992 [Conoideocrella luteorostrata]|uniref:Uncharacterized protein n=1 Tax=Conoideocrella luteorostrata TaxID=1105319 RepID=A0AAJ0FPU6_9HYPO|nr:hypothetical protein QQS21_009992 [Conoideocrella luteorostrata]
MRLTCLLAILSFCRVSVAGTVQHRRQEYGPEIEPRDDTLTAGRVNFNFKTANLATGGYSAWYGPEQMRRVVRDCHAFAKDANNEKHSSDCIAEVLTTLAGHIATYVAAGYGVPVLAGQPAVGVVSNGAAQINSHQPYPSEHDIMRVKLAELSNNTLTGPASLRANSTESPMSLHHGACLENTEDIQEKPWRFVWDGEDTGIKMECKPGCYDSTMLMRWYSEEFFELMRNVSREMVATQNMRSQFTVYWAQDFAGLPEGTVIMRCHTVFEEGQWNDCVEGITGHNCYF